LEHESLRGRERDFLTASLADLRRQRRVKRIALVAAPLLLFAVFIGFRVQQTRELAGKVEQQLARAEASLAEARAAQDQAVRLRDQAFAEFDARRSTAEARWKLARAAVQAADRRYRATLQALETVLGLDFEHTGARARLGEAIFERAVAAEASGKLELAAELIERLPQDSPQLARWGAPGRLSLATDPPSAVTLAEYRLDPDTLRRELGPARALGDTPVRGLVLAQGSYRLGLRVAGGDEVVYPLLVARAQQIDLDLRLPRPGQLPAGFVFVPAGQSPIGSADEEMIRNFFVTVPQHPVRLPAYVIARHETTYAQWLAFLRDLPPDERARYLPSSETMLLGAGIILAQDADGRWSLSMSAGERTLHAVEGEPIAYPGRTAHATQDWLQMPVGGINFADAVAYLAWLDRSGRVPGARLCSDWEWERAARGVDGRVYPHGDRLAPGEANIDRTYGDAAENRGPDMVGLHPESRSPFGVDDMTGNNWEWVRSSVEDGGGVVRGGAFAYEETTAASLNRNRLPLETRDSTVGLRVCASIQ
ncbi:MAG TPA: formylglycine-generating enzyme family protein, partial [Nannocystis sp.]